MVIWTSRVSVAAKDSTYILYLAYIFFKYTHIWKKPIFGKVNI
jgi:hypothetical protein